MTASLQRRSALYVLFSSLIYGSLFVAVPFAWPQADEAADVAAEEARQASVAKRFATILEKSPRRGTAFDRVYGFHVEYGSLDKFVADLRTRLKEEADDGAGWMILGMIEAHRGQDADAVDAFKQAEEKRTSDALASYYLGQSQLLIGQTEQAVLALERAIERKPERADLLEIFQQLGRMHQRAQRDAEALQVWARLEAMFPNDPRVLEQIAAAQVDEGKFADALPRYERLVQLVKDDYRKTTYRMEVAALKIRSNNRPGGLADLESLLGDLNPDGWLHREVRRRIEEVFLRSGDQDGLVKYYQGWLAKHDQDVDGMARLAKFLASSARVPEATEWLEKALKLAPKRSELRRAFITQLVDDQRYSEAVQQFALLSQSSPGDSDVLRDWGKAVLKDKSLEVAARNAEAGRIWRLILAARPDDALTTAQVADMFRQSNLTEEATALYEKSVALAPNDPQYREYLGEYYHVQKKPEQAMATWKQIAEGERKTALNLSRLAEVLNTFSYTKESTAYIAEAAKLDPKDLSLQLKAADYHGRADKFDEALQYVEAAGTLAANDDEREAVLKQKIETLQSARKLEQETEKLATALKENKTSTGEEWQTLARYFEADRQWAEASEAIATALEKSPQSTPVLAAASRIAELSGDFKKAADFSRQLATSDRRARGDHLMNVSRLESQLGRADEALQAGRDLILSAPGNTEHYEFYAQLCFRLGKLDEGLETLRKAVRINPTEAHLITALAAALADQFKADEAIQVYWQAFEKSETVEDKTALMLKLTDLHLQLNQFDRLIERLERDRREEEKRRTATICIAQAHQSAGDFGAARAELESLLSQDTRDTELLQQLSKLCEQGHDRDAAITYQRQIVAIAPGHETEFRLAGLLQANGDVEPATEIFVKLTRREEDPARLLRSLDALLSANSYHAAIAVTEPLLRENRDNWELIYREGLAWASLDKKAEAEDRFQRILALAIPHDTLGIRAADQLKQAQAKAKSANIMGTATAVPTRPSPLQAASNSYQIRSAVGLDFGNYSPSMMSGTTARIWTPDSFASARMAALGWRLRFAQAAGQEDSFVAAIEKAAEPADAPRDVILDQLYLRSLQSKPKEIYAVAKRLAKKGGAEEQAFYLQYLSQRTYDPNVVRNSRDPQPKVPPMPDDELDLMLACYEGVQQHAQKSKAPSPYGLQMSGYNLPGGSYVYIAANMSNLSMVLRELRNANRTEQADKLLESQLASAATATDLAGAISLCTAEKLYDRIPPLFDRWHKAVEDELAKNPKSAIPAPRQLSRSPLAQSSYVLLQWSGALAEQKKHEELLKLLDVATELGIREAKIRRTAKKSPQTPQRSSTSYRYWYGTQQSSSQFAYPPPNDHVDSTLLSMLRQTYEVFRRNDVQSDLIAHLKKRLAESAPDDRLYRQLVYGYLLWWQEDQQEEAIKVISAAAELLPDDPQFRMELASLHQAHGDLDVALTLIDSVAPRDQKLMQARETMALALAERLGEIDRARAAAERLFGLRLDSDAQLSLSATMRRLGLADMADAVTSRVERRSGNSPSAMLTLMMQYQGQGRAEMAEQLAHTLLQRTARPNSQTAAMIASGRMSSSGDSAARQQALRLLAQTGGLKKLIERAEGQLALAPKSPPLYEQLIEYHTVANNRDQVQKLLTAAIEQRPEAVELRMLLASQLEAANKLPEACEMYLKVLQERPDLVSNNFYQLQNLFERAKRTPDLAKAVLATDLKRYRQPYYVTSLATNMLAREETREQGVLLFEKCFNEMPTYRNNLIGNLHDPAALKDQRVFDICAKCLIPTDAQLTAQPWFGFDQINSYSGNGVANGLIDRLLTSAKGTEHAAKLRGLIEDRLKTAEGWLGGRAALAVLDIAEGKKEQGTEALKKLFPDEASLENVPQAPLWLIGLQLDQSDATRDLAVSLYKKAMQLNSSGNDFEYTPGMRLVKLYTDRGDKEKAREVLKEGLKPQSNISSDPAYQAYQKLRTDFSIARSLLQAQYPADSLRIYRNLLNNPELIEQGSAIYSNGAQQAESYKQQARSGMTQALTALTTSNVDEAITQLLMSDSVVAAGQPQLDLLLIIPDQSQIATSTMASPLTDLFETIKDNAAASSACEKQLATLRQAAPDDLSVATVDALWAKRLQPDDFAKRIAALQEIVRRHPLEELPATGRPNSRQRAEAARSIGIWLVGRECLKRPEHREVGAELAAVALEAASRQLDRNAKVAILYEWGKVAIENGDRAEAEKRWTQLLESATTRPKSERNKTPLPQPRATPAPQPAAPPAVPAALKRRPVVRAQFVSMQIPAPAAAPRPGPMPPPQRNVPASPRGANVVPPLTLSQFRIAMQVARVAAEHNMPQLSQRAVKDALHGGMPVPDAPAGSTAIPVMSGGTVRLVRPGANPIDAIDPTLQEVAVALRGVVELWTPEHYPAADVCTILEPLVFPPTRTTEILLYPDSSRLQQGIVNSAGLQLLKWSERAGRLPQLKDLIAARRESPSAKIPALVLDIELALQAKDTPAAAAALKRLDQASSASTTPATTQLAGHAAIHAFDVDELKPEAMPILKRVIQSALPTQAQIDRGDETSLSLGPLSARFTKYLVKTDNQPALKEFYDSYATTRQQRYARYSGDYGAYQLWMDWASIANDAAENGASDIAFDYLGRVADQSFENYTRPAIKTALVMSVLSSRTRSPQQRYELWRDWTLPHPQRESFRIVVDIAPPLQVPETFLKASGNRTLEQLAPLRENGPVSNVTQLLDAAQAAGQLQDLKEKIAPWKEKKIPFADALLAMVLIRSSEIDQVKPMVKDLLKARDSRTGINDATLRNTTHWVDFLVWREILNCPPLNVNAVTDLPYYLEFARTTSQFVAYPRIIAEFARQQRTAAEIPTDRSPEFKHWAPAMVRTAPGDSVAPWWTVTEGQITHLGGVGTDVLFFKYPLEGDFQFSAETSHSKMAQAEVGFGGVLVNCQSANSGQMEIVSAGFHETIARPGAKQREDIGFNRTQVQVSEEKLVHLLNGSEVYSETLTGTSPWLQLVSDKACVTAYRNLKITGEPRIPREVQLLRDKYMEGWITLFLRETQPTYRRQNEKPRVDPNDFNSGIVRQQFVAPAEYGWQTQEGVLTGRLSKGANPDAAGWTYYHRPLFAGESTACEFFYDPGKSEAHPTFGRLAFLLSPSGIRTRWIVQQGTWDDSVLGIPVSNSVEEPQYRKGDGPLLLKAGEWNKLAMAVQNDTLVLALNGTVVLERPIDADSTRTFGVYHPLSVEAKVRNVVLTGPWPEKLTDEIRNELLALTTPLKPAERKAQSLVLGDENPASRVSEVLRTAATLPDAQAYKYLHDWVLPSDDHIDIRPYFTRRPVGAESPDTIASGESTRISPAWELVKVAKRLGRLDELAGEVEGLSKTPAARKPARRLAMLVLVDVGRENDEGALKHLTALKEFRAKGASPGGDDWERAPEIVAITAAAQRLALVAMNDDFARELRDKARRDDKTPFEWLRTVETLAGETQSLASPHKAEPLALRQWREVPVETAASRAQGMSLARWSVRTGEVASIPGEAASQLFFQSPIEGNFEIVGEFSIRDRDVMRPGYGLVSATPDIGKEKKTLVSRLLHSATTLGAALALPEDQETASFRIAVEGSKMTTFIGDVKIHEHRFLPRPSPWLVLQPRMPGSMARARNLRILGSPQVPESVDLLQDTESTAWRTNYYGEIHSLAAEIDRGQLNRNQPNPVWSRSGDELLGALNTQRSGKPLQSVIYYQRPVLEDGQIEFESFYVPGEFEIHPAIGRTALVIEPAGTRRHLLTDAEYELSDLMTDNSAPIPGAAAVALKPNDWNRIRLVVKGADLTLFVNDAEVARETLTEPPTQRFFGLFRYSDQRKCRVRNIVYRGNWPKAVPPIAEQELALPDAPRAASASIRRVD